MPLVLVVLLLLVYLIWERLRLDRALSAVPLRIAVTGTRGKSTVVRLLASVLRESGRRVLAKTTGSQAALILPDGTERIIRRRGRPSILEQKKCVYQAARAGADCLVTELMSIHRENHIVESRGLIRPHIVAVTNARVDHCDAMGHSEDEVASVLAESFVPTSRVFVPVGELRAAFETGARQRGASLHLVEEGAHEQPDAAVVHFSRDLDLVVGICRHLGVDSETVARGLARATLDVGRLRLWRYPREAPANAVFVVNGFAANDPRSTREALDKALALLPSTRGKVAGLLSLRSDRGDRSLQWVTALRGEARTWFDSLFIVGGHAVAARRALGWGQVIGGKDPDRIMASVKEGLNDRDVVFGFGNLGGKGRELVELWETKGEEHGP